MVPVFEWLQSADPFTELSQMSVLRGIDPSSIMTVNVSLNCVITVARAMFVLMVDASLYDQYFIQGRTYICM